VTAITGNPPRHFEITTLRRDVETYGRRARVAFDADWAADAARRDFTINAIFLDPDGTVHDPVGGLADLRARRVRFVGDPAIRIAEDVLRILRYYRFEARFGAGLGDPQARAACRAMAHLLPNLSAERVAQELVKLLETADPVAALRMMAEDGVLSVIVPEARRVDRLRHIIAIEPEPDPLRRLAALIQVDSAGAIALAERLHFSNAWRNRLHGLAPPWAVDPDADVAAQRRALYRLGAERYRDITLLLAAQGAMSEDRLGELLALARDWRRPAFPLAGRDVTALGIPPGPRVGRLLDAMRAWYEAGDFTADRAACLARLKELAKPPDRPA
jgi:poly(A) polymerase